MFKETSNNTYHADIICISFNPRLYTAYSSYFKIYFNTCL